MNEEYYSEALGEGLAKLAAPGERITLCRAEKGSEALPEILKRAGFACETVILYETEIPDGSLLKARVKSRMGQGELDYVTFTSASTVHGFLQMLAPSREELGHITAACIGRETKKAAVLAGMRCIVAETPTMDSLIESICRDACGA